MNWNHKNKLLKFNIYPYDKTNLAEYYVNIALIYAVKYSQCISVKFCNLYIINLFIY